MRFVTRKYLEQSEFDMDEYDRHQFNLESLRQENLDLKASLEEAKTDKEALRFKLDNQVLSSTETKKLYDDLCASHAVVLGEFKTLEAKLSIAETTISEIDSNRLVVEERNKSLQSMCNERILLQMEATQMANEHKEKLKCTQLNQLATIQVSCVHFNFVGTS